MPLTLKRPFADGPAPREEEDQLRRRVQCGTKGFQARDHGDERPCRARAREGRNHLAGDHRLAARGLHVDHRALAADDDGFRDIADLHLDRNRQSGRAAQLDVLAPHLAEARERERERVRSRIEIHDPIHACVVGDGRTNFFDEYRTRGFDRDARQHSARRITYCSGERAARERPLRRRSRW
jgi:hypothetical protein